MRPIRTRLLCLLLLLTGLPSLLSAQPFRHLKQTYAPAPPASLAAWQERAETLRTHLLVSNGLWPMPERAEPEPLYGPLQRGDGYTAQSVALETLPGLYLTGTVYRPAAGDGPFPAVLSPHGHWKAGRFEQTEVASVPARGIAFARQGYVAFTYSMVGYNESERPDFPHRFTDPRYDLWGFTPSGLQLWNSLYALDLLTALPDVDPARVGMTGASGGGTQTFLLTAVDPRIRVAAPVNMISNHYQGGCVCENAPLLRLDATNVEIGALAAPRPLLLVSTAGDWTTNTPKVEYPALQAWYRLFDAEDRVANRHFGYDHNYNRDSREAVYSWFAQWLQGRPGPVKEAPTGQVDPSTLQAPMPAPPATLDAVAGAWISRAEAQLDAARPTDWFSLFRFRESFGTALAHVLLVPDLPPAPDVQAFLPQVRSDTAAALLIVHADEPAAAAAARARAQAHQRRGGIAFTFAPHAEAAPDSLHHADTYNPTPAAREVAAIRQAAAAALTRADVPRLDLVGHGTAGPLTLLARAFLPQIRHTEVDFSGFTGTDADFLRHLYVPLLRRAGDVRTAAALIAPAPLQVENLPPGALRAWFEDVYRAAGASAQLQLR